MSTETQERYRIVEERRGEVTLTESYAELLDAANAMLNECGGEEGMPGDTAVEIIDYVSAHGGLTVRPYPGCVVRLMVMGSDEGPRGSQVNTSLARDIQPPSLTDELMRMVSVEARKQNGWEVLGIDCTSGSDGVIRFHRPHAPSGCHYGTAHFSTDGRDEVAFEWGHYDLGPDEARRDFAHRIEVGR